MTWIWIALRIGNTIYELIKFSSESDKTSNIELTLIITLIGSCLDLDMSEFVLKEMLVTAISQVMIASRNKGVRIMHDLSQELMDEGFYGDRLRLQQIVSDFLLVSVNSSPSDGQIEIVARVVKDKLGKALHVANLDLRYTTWILFFWDINNIIKPEMKPYHVCISGYHTRVAEYLKPCYLRCLAKTKENLKMVSIYSSAGNC